MRDILEWRELQIYYSIKYLSVSGMVIIICLFIYYYYYYYYSDGGKSIGSLDLWGSLALLTNDSVSDKVVINIIIYD